MGLFRPAFANRLPTLPLEPHAAEACSGSALGHALQFEDSERRIKRVDGTERRA